MLHRIFPEQSGGEVRDRDQQTHTNADVYSVKSQIKACTLVFSLCHEGAIKKLHHGILLLVLWAAESKTAPTVMAEQWKII